MRWDFCSIRADRSEILADWCEALAANALRHGYWHAAQDWAMRTAALRAQAGATGSWLLKDRRLPFTADAVARAQMVLDARERLLSDLADQQEALVAIRQRHGDVAGAAIGYRDLADTYRQLAEVRRRLER